MQALAVLLSLAAAASLYLSAPNQVLCVDDSNNGRAPMPPRVLFWLGIVLAIAGTWIMSILEGWPVAIAATLVTLTCSLSAWPFVGTWIHHKRYDDVPGEGSAS